MKTTTPILSLILAAASTVSAQQPVQSGETASATARGPIVSANGSGTLSISGSDASATGTPEKPITLTISDGVGEPPLFNNGPGGYLGVSHSPLPREMAAQLTVPENTGLLLDFVAEGSPAAKAGLLKGDVLVKLDDQILIHPRQFAVLVGSHKEGESVKLGYIRNGQPMEATAVIGKREAEEAPPGTITLSFGSESGKAGKPDQVYSGKIQVAPQGSAKAGESATSGQAAEKKEAAPPTPPAKVNLTQILDGKLSDAAGKPANTDSIKKAKYVVVYCSAHWCGACTSFTPELVKFVNENRKDDNFEVVLVSSDESQKAMEAYMTESKMPWNGVHRDKITGTGVRDNVSGIPHLRVFDAEGNVIIDAVKDGQYVGPRYVLKELKKKI